MTRKRAARLLIVLACLIPSGCAGFAQTRAERQQAPSSPADGGDNEHADLERELSLYSD